MNKHIYSIPEAMAVKRKLTWMGALAIGIQVAAGVGIVIMAIYWNVDAPR
jgi:hypothetical protein